MAAVMTKNPMGEIPKKPNHNLVEEDLSVITTDQTTLMYILKRYLKKTMIFHTQNGMIEKASSKSFKWFRPEEDGVNEYWFNTDLLSNDMKVRYSAKGGDYEEMKRSFIGHLDTYFKTNREVVVKTIKGVEVPVGKLRLVYQKKTLADAPEAVTSEELYNPKITNGCVLRLGDMDLLRLKKERPSKEGMIIHEGEQKLTLSMAVVLNVSKDTGSVVKKTSDDMILLSVCGSSNRKKMYMGSSAVFPPLNTQCTLVAHMQQLVCGYETGKGVRMTSHAVASTKQSKKRKRASGDEPDREDGVKKAEPQQEIEDAVVESPPQKKKRTQRKKATPKIANKKNKMILPLITDSENEDEVNKEDASDGFDMYYYDASE